MKATALIFMVLLTAGTFTSLANAEEGSMKLTSTAFSENAPIPAKYTCQGDDVNPPLEISGIPPAAKTLALIVDDPDAPMKTWVHWVVFNIAPTGEIKEASVPGLQGSNDFHKNAWGGPCPPSGTHRYYFKLYALDSTLDLKEGATKEQLEGAMKGRTLTQAQLMGVYQKK